MTRVLWWSLGVLLTIGIAAPLGSCGSTRLREEREEREARINVYPDHYRADLVAAVHTYLSDPRGVRDAYVSTPTISAIGRQNRYAACVRFNARNSDGRYGGSTDVLAVFVGGRFDQFIDAATPFGPGNETNASTFVKETCAAAEYKRFPELEAMTR